MNLSKLKVYDPMPFVTWHHSQINVVRKSMLFAEAVFWLTLPSTAH
jgi:hypothetical protein